MAPLDCLAFGESISNLRPLVFKKCSIIYLGAGEEATAEHWEPQWMEWTQRGTPIQGQHTAHLVYLDSDPTGQFLMGCAISL